MFVHLGLRYRSARSECALHLRSYVDRAAGEDFGALAAHVADFGGAGFGGGFDRGRGATLRIRILGIVAVAGAFHDDGEVVAFVVGSGPLDRNR